MISEKMNNIPKKENTWRDILIIILVFALLAILVWRWFDFRIASLSHAQLKPSYMMVPVDAYTIHLKL